MNLSLRLSLPIRSRPPTLLSWLGLTGQPQEGSQTQTPRTTERPKATKTKLSHPDATLAMAKHWRGPSFSKIEPLSDLLNDIWRPRPQLQPFPTNVGTPWLSREGQFCHFKYAMRMLARISLLCSASWGQAFESCCLI